MALMKFPTPPAVPLWRLAAKRGRRDGTFPRIEATAARLVGSAVDYARLTGFAVADPLPLTFPDVLARGLQLAVLTAPEFPIPLLGILHTEQRIEAHRPIGANEPLSARVWVEGFRTARSGGEFDLHTAVFADRELVWEGVTTILSRHLPGDGVKRPAPERPEWRTTRSTIWSLAPDLGRQYAAVSGDNNPIHLWPLTARLFGFKRPIAHGWWALARCLAELDHEVPGAAVVTAKFSAPLPLPGRATFVSGPMPWGGTHFELRRGARVAVHGEVRER